MSYEPAEDGGPDPQTVTRPSRVQAGGCPGSFIFHEADSGGHDPQRLRARPGSSRRPLPDGFTIHERTTDYSKATPCGAARFPAGARTLPGSSSRAESGAIEAHGLHRALVSSEARFLIGSLSIEARAGLEPASPALQAGT